MDEQKEVEEKQAIEVLQHPQGVRFRPVYPGNQMIIHPDPPWNGWAENKDKMGGKVICQFIPWPKAETETEKKEDPKLEDLKKGEDKEKVKDETEKKKEDIKTDEVKTQPEAKAEEKEKDSKTDEVKK